jgi:hypothetical protein
MPRSGLLQLVTSGRGEPSAWATADQYWDAVVRDAPLPAQTIDPILAATLHYLQNADDTPLPDTAFASRLEGELLRSAHPRHLVQSSAPAGVRAEGSDGSVVLTGWPTLTRRMAMNIAAAAALLAIVFTSTLVALWIGSLSVRDHAPLPLVLAPGITDEKLLLQARFDTIPDGVLNAAVSRWVLQPGAEVVMGRQETSGTAAAAYLVETGALSVRPDGAIAVTRAEAMTPTAVPEASWTTLLPGDRMFTPEGVTSLWRNEGTHPARILEAAYASRDVQPQATGVLHYPVISDGPTTKPDRPVVMTLIEITLHPEGALPAASVPGLAMLKVESGRLVAIDVDGLGNPLPPVELGQATRFLGSFPPGRVFRSGNDEPVRLLLVTIADANPLGTTT